MKQFKNNFYVILLFVKHFDEQGKDKEEQARANWRSKTCSDLA